MPRPFALSSFQQPNTDIMAEELYPDFFSESSTLMTNLPPEASLEGFAPDVSLENDVDIVQTEQLDFPSGSIGFSTNSLTTFKEPRTTEQLSPATEALNVPATQSLVSALQATMGVNQVIRQPVVIPGQKGSVRKAAKRSVSKRHMPARLRLSITLGAVLGILLISLLTLSPLSSADSNTPLIGNLVGWVHTQQLSWSSMASHLVGNQPQTTAKTMQPAVPPIAVLSQSQYVAIAQQDAIANGISPTFFTRQIMLESGFNPRAASPYGAVGIAQFLPSTAAGLGFNPYDPVAALQGAAKYMANLSNSYGGDYAKALAAYNAGSATVNYAVQQGGTNWMNFLPPETRNYIARIMGV